jgi:hypothetical protein
MKGYRIMKKKMIIIFSILIFTFIIISFLFYKFTIKDLDDGITIRNNLMEDFLYIENGQSKENISTLEISYDFKKVLFRKDPYTIKVIYLDEKNTEYYYNYNSEKNQITLEYIKTSNTNQSSFKHK